jgi:F-type H+-transporting ATPase subunit a
VANDPIKQFEIHDIVPISIGNLDLSFTNSSMFMVATLAATTGFLYMATSGRALIPTRVQSIGEIAYEFVALDVARCGGHAGHAVLPAGLLALHVRAVCQPVWHVPLFLHRHSHIIVTFALAMLVIGTVIVYGFMKHGFEVPEALRA